MYDKKTFEEAVKPAIKWLNENTNPHSSIEITPTGAELKNGELSIVVDEFIKD